MGVAVGVAPVVHGLEAAEAVEEVGPGQERRERERLKDKQGFSTCGRDSQVGHRRATHTHTKKKNRETHYS